MSQDTLIDQNFGDNFTQLFDTGRLCDKINSAPFYGRFFVFFQF